MKKNALNTRLEINVFGKTVLVLLVQTRYFKAIFEATSDPPPPADSPSASGHERHLKAMDSLSDLTDCRILYLHVSLAESPLSLSIILLLFTSGSKINYFSEMLPSVCIWTSGTLRTALTDKYNFTSRNAYRFFKVFILTFSSQ